MSNSKHKKEKFSAESEENNKIFKFIRNIFRSEPGKKFSFKQIKKKMDEEFGKDEIYFGIKILQERGELVNRGSHYHWVNPERSTGKEKENTPAKTAASVKTNTVTGHLEVTTSGYGFVVVEGQEVDIKISHRGLGNAMDGDEVRVALHPSRKGKRLEGEVVEVLKRGQEQFIGTIEILPRFAFVVPDKNVGADFYVPLDKIGGAKNGDKVLLRMISWADGVKNPTGEVLKTLGKAGSNDVEMNSILFESGFRLEFPPDALNEMKNIPEQISPEEIARRRDFRDVLTFTIDPEDAKDFDDAVSYRVLPNGNFEIGVHIADVSHYVLPGTALDKEAEYRATSVYLVDRVIPMFPEKISNEVCSLRPREEKLTFSVVFEMDETGKVHNQWFGRTVIFSDRRFTYEEAQQLIEGHAGAFGEEVRQLNQLAFRLREKRFKNGSINFETVEVKFKLDEQGKPIGLFVKERKEAHMLIEDFMLLANEAVAEHVGKQKMKGKPIPMVYRVHDLPNPEKLEMFSEFARLFGHKLNFTTPHHISASLNKLMEEIKGRPEQNALESLAIRTMAKAVYQTENIGHYGLAFKYYTHFTSPIRRYPDVLAHRILANCLSQQTPIKEAVLEEQCKHSSAMERNAAEAERASVKYKQVEFMQDHVGEQYDGIITGVTQWGIFVEMMETKCEGLVRLDSIKEDYYVFDEKKMHIKGRETGKAYRLGDQVKVLVRRTNLEKKQIDLLLVEA